METKDLQFDVKAIEDDGTFSGLLSTYGNIDRVSDAIVPGAFSATIAANKGVIPLLWSHDRREPLGSLELCDTSTGLAVKGRLVLDVSRAREIYALMKRKIVKSLSIGFNILRSSEKDGIRYLEVIELFEGSLCLFPANPLAQVDFVKSDIREHELTVALQRARLEIVAALKGDPPPFETPLERYRREFKAEIWAALGWR